MIAICKCVDDNLFQVRGAYNVDVSISVTRTMYFTVPELGPR